MNERELRDHRIQLIMAGRTKLEAIETSDNVCVRAWWVDGQPAVGDDLAALTGTSLDDAAEALLLGELRNEIARDAMAVRRSAAIDAFLRVALSPAFALLDDPDWGHEEA
jgi:hypothetical protein